MTTDTGKRRRPERGDGVKRAKRAAQRERVGVGVGPTLSE